MLRVDVVSCKKDEGWKRRMGDGLVYIPRALAGRYAGDGLFGNE